ncbi:uncharacterized protein LOC143242642 isoform X1 [Tachypleus tridentatus]|uniref:uncharacterized protein LOC143242642 isoform X1 n=1 Tax=Tachypleus tridentatus TaxID=6853 RepID=UPI003FD30D71
MEQGGEKRGPNGNAGVHLQDSDGDSGIVAVSRRIGSVCSNETDSSQDNIRKKSRDISANDSLELPNKYSLKPTLKSSSVSNLHSCNEPMKDDRNTMLERGPVINRSTPLAVHSSFFKNLSSPRVRFDEDLQLTEQNIRRSCRKLFSSLYVQNTAASRSGHIGCSYSSSGTSDAVLSNLSETRNPVGIARTGKSFYTGKSQEYLSNLPQEADSSNISGMKSGSQTLPSKTFRTSWSYGVVTTKHPAYKTRYRLGQQLSVPLDLSSISHHYGSNANRLSSGKEKNGIEKNISRSNSDIYAGVSPTIYQTTKDIQQHSCSSTNLQTNVSESSHVYNMPSCTNLDERQQLSKASLFKSKSCTTLPSETNLRAVEIPSLDPHLYLDQENNEFLGLGSPHQLVSKVKNQNCKKVRRDRDSNCVLYSDDMIKVYARLASVVPEGTKVQEETTLSHSISTEDNLQHSFKSGNSQTSKYAHCTQVLRDSEYHQTFDTDNQIRETLYPGNSNTSNFFAHNSSLSTATHSLLNYKSEEHVVAAEDKTGTGVEAKDQEVHTVSSLNNQGLIPVKAKQVGMTEHALIGNRKSYRSQEISCIPRVISNPCITSCEGNALCHEQEPPVPPKMLIHRSDFSLYKGSSPSKKSLRERVQGFTRSATNALQKAFSMERVYRPDKEERLEKARRSRRSHSFMKSLRIRMSTRGGKGKTHCQSDTLCHDSIKPHFSPHESEDTSGNTPPLFDHVWGQLVQLHEDGSQVVELRKPPKKPFGFFLARGRIRNCKGVFVSRMRDHEAMNLLSGLIDIGDEILEIDDVNVKEKDIIEVNSLMAKKNNIFLTILPYSSRKDV